VPWLSGPMLTRSQIARTTLSLGEVCALAGRPGKTLSFRAIGPLSIRPWFSVPFGGGVHRRRHGL